ncbi:MAG: ATP-binding protein, partial [Bacteroidaceae bacterium]|nr:ATP-binding protein [Bacteroidaceae bacterium]
FETLCWNHVPQIKKALGIAAVQTVEFSWRAETTDEYPGAQIDLIIRRADRIVNLCEMKFSISEYLIDKSDDASLRNKIATYQRLTGCKESIHPIIVTTYGLVANKYSLSIQKVVTMDNLFED